MELCRRFLCILLTAFLLIPLSVAAEETGVESYSEYILEPGRTAEERTQAFLDDPLLFISVLAREKYGVMINTATFTFEPADVKKHGDKYKQTLLTLAQQNQLTQAERRVVRWMLSELGAEYDMWTEEVDYCELFSRCAEMDGALPAYYSEELEEVFLMDPYRFLQEMADSDADKEQLAWILMDHIYYGNYDRQETEKLLQSMERSENLKDAQAQMLQQLRNAVEGLIELYGPLPERPTADPDTQQTEIPTDITQPAPKEPDEKSDWRLPVLGIALLLTAAIVILCLLRKKAEGSAHN